MTNFGFGCKMVTFYVIILSMVGIGLMIFDVNGHYNDLKDNDKKLTALYEVMIKLCPEEGRINRLSFDQAYRQIKKAKRSAALIESQMQVVTTTTTIISSKPSSSMNNDDDDDDQSTESMCAEAKLHTPLSDEQLRSGALHLMSQHYKICGELCLLGFAVLLNPSNFSGSVIIILMLIVTIIILSGICCFCNCNESKKRMDNETVQRELQSVHLADADDEDDYKRLLKNTRILADNLQYPPPPSRYVGSLPSPPIPLKDKMNKQS